LTNATADSQEASLAEHGLRVPDHVPAALLREFDHVNGLAVERDAFAVYRDAPKMRAFFSPLNGGFWVLTKTDDIRAALQDAELFSSAATGIPAQPERKEKLYPLELDPPEHRPYRQVLAPFFAPKAVAAKAASIGRVCVELLEPLASQGFCEFNADFAQPFPTTIFTEMLGLPNSESKQFVEWNSVLLHGHDDPARRASAAADINTYLRDLVDQRAKDGQDDLVSKLLDTTIDGHPVSREAVQNFTFLLFVAGLDTVTAALSFAFRFLAENPAHRQQLLDDAQLVPSAVEELLRVFSFVNMGRTVVRDVEFAGVQMKAGDRVLTSTTFASMDPDEFDNPLTVDFGRRAIRHLAFGAGPHRCAGSHLAREELRTAIREFHLRIPHYEAVRVDETRMHGGGSMGMDRLWLRWPEADADRR
jgi:cytochrome P450